MPRFHAFFLSVLLGCLVFAIPLAESHGASTQTQSATSKQPAATLAKPAKATVATSPARPTATTKPNKQPTQQKPAVVTTVAKPAKPTGGTQQQKAAATPSAKVRTVDTARERQPAAKPVVSVATAANQRNPAPTAARPLPKVACRPTETPDSGSSADIDQQISSRSAVIIDAHTGEELFTKYPDIPRQPASTIKIVTAMIALKSLRNDDVVDVSTHAAGMPSSKINLDPSKQYQANDLINAVLLASANDASVALAEKIAGSENNFSNLMTISAKLWGARNTVCRTASGLTAVGQQSTARDLAQVFRYAMQHDEFARRMHEKFITTSYGKVLRNHNKALWRLDGAVGGKTGYTVAARQTYVGQFSRDDQTIVVAVMGSESMWADLKKLVEYGFLKKRHGQLAQASERQALVN